MALGRSLNLLAAAVVGLGSAAAANAALVTNWDWVVTTEWTAANFSTGSGTTSVTSDIVSWGATGGDHHVFGLPATESRSGIDITPAGPVSSPPQAITNGGFVDTHTFTHYNNTISSAFAALETATVGTTLTLTPSGGGALPVFSTSFDVNFIETLNSAPCGFDSDTVCDDIFVLTLPSDVTTPFTFDGVTYTIEIGGALAPLSDEACITAGAAPGCFGLQTREGTTTDAQFAFQITAAVPAPEPGVLALIGLGLAGLGFFGRRRA